MSDPYSPDSFRDHNGQHTWQSLTNYGQHAANQGWSSPVIQPEEIERGPGKTASAPVRNEFSSAAAWIGQLKKTVLSSGQI